MGIFGIKNWFEDRQKLVLRKEIEKIIDNQQVESNALLQDWNHTDQTQGRNHRVSYKTLESIYKKESWVRAAVGAIQRASTSNGFRLVTKDHDDERPLSKRETHKIMKLLRNPNPEDSFSDIIGNAIVDLHIFGDAYIEVVRNEKTGLPVALYNLNVPSIKILVNKFGKVLGYIQNIGGFGSDSKPIVFDSRDVVHLKLPNPGNAVYGLSPLESLSMPIETDLHAQTYNLNFFKNNATPKLHVDLGQCTVAQLKRTREFFRLHFQGQGNSHKTLITEGDVKVNPISIKPSDMEFLEQRKFSRQEILSVYGVPPMKVGIFDDVNRASAKESDQTFKSETITPLQRMIANKLNLCVISLFNQSRVVLEFSELDLRDAKEQAEIDAIDIASGVVGINEVRKARGLKPLKDPKPADTESSKPETKDPKEKKPEEVEQNFDYIDEPLEKELGTSERLYHFR